MTCLPDTFADTPAMLRATDLKTPTLCGLRLLVCTKKFSNKTCSLAFNALART